MAAISGLYLLEMSAQSSVFRFFGSWAECHDHMKLNEDRFDCVIRPAHHDDVEAQIARLTDSLERVRRDYENSPWGMGPSYRQQMDAIESRIRHFHKFLEPSSSLSGEAAPAGDNATTHPHDLAGADPMTLAEAREAVMRPESDDADLLRACKVIDRDEREPFYRAIAENMLEQFAAKIVEVE